MPIKRRIEKSRSIDNYKVEELLHGPGTGLLAGLGYSRRDFGGSYHNMKPDQQAAVIDAMRLDWEVHYERVLKEAKAAGIAKPWASIQFGETK
jgi:hypothetical protein